MELKKGCYTELSRGGDIPFLVIDTLIKVIYDSYRSLHGVMWV